VLGTSAPPDVSWMTSTGDAILGAHIKEIRTPFIG
jgi:hypothetical protein